MLLRFKHLRKCLSWLIKINACIVVYFVRLKLIYFILTFLSFSNTVPWMSLAYWMICYPFVIKLILKEEKVTCILEVLVCVAASGFEVHINTSANKCVDTLNLTFDIPSWDWQVKERCFLSIPTDRVVETRGPLCSMRSEKRYVVFLILRFHWELVFSQVTFMNTHEEPWTASV